MALAAKRSVLHLNPSGGPGGLQPQAAEVDEALNDCLDVVPGIRVVPLHHVPGRAEDEERCQTRVALADGAIANAFCDVSLESRLARTDPLTQFLPQLGITDGVELGQRSHG